MKSLKKKRRIQIVAIATVALVISTALIGYAMRDGINFFRAPADRGLRPAAADRGLPHRRAGRGRHARARRGGDDHLQRDRWRRVIPVTYTGILPDLFGEGEGMVGTGSLVNGVFQATEILARHDETYMPEEVIDALQEQGVYRDPNAPES
jgi:cytochrome c-type biogenesis protein CcmE